MQKLQKAHGERHPTIAQIQKATRKIMDERIISGLSKMNEQEMFNFQSRLYWHRVNGSSADKIISSFLHLVRQAEKRKKQKKLPK